MISNSRESTSQKSQNCMTAVDTKCVNTIPCMKSWFRNHLANMRRRKGNLRIDLVHPQWNMIIKQKEHPYTGSSLKEAKGKIFAPSKYGGFRLKYFLKNKDLHFWISNRIQVALLCRCQYKLSLLEANNMTSKNTTNKAFHLISSAFLWAKT